MSAKGQDIYIGERLLSSLRVVDLKEELIVRGLPKSGTKAELSDRLREAVQKGENALSEPVVDKVAETQIESAAVSCNDSVPPPDLTQETSKLGSDVKESQLVQELPAADFKDTEQETHSDKKASPVTNQEHSTEEIDLEHNDKQRDGSGSSKSTGSSSSSDSSDTSDGEESDKSEQEEGEASNSEQEIVKADNGDGKDVTDTATISVNGQKEIDKSEQLETSRTIDLPLPVDQLVNTFDSTKSSTENNMVSINQEETARVSATENQEECVETMKAHVGEKEDTAAATPSKVTAKPLSLPRRIHLGSRPKSTESTNNVSSESEVRRSSWGSKSKTSRQTSITISSETLKSLIPKQTSPKLEQENGETVSKIESDDIKENNVIESETEIKKESTSADTKNTEVESTGRKEWRRKIIIVKERSDDTENNQVQAETEETISPQAAPIVTRHKLEQVIPADKVAVTRKLPDLPVDEPKRVRETSPARNAESNIINIRNLVRPFTIKQLKGLLTRHGEIVDEDFYIDGIKSHCIVTYQSKDAAVAARTALHGTMWPSGNQKVLKVEYATMDELNRHRGIVMPEKDDQKENRKVDNKEEKSRRKRSRSRDRKNSREEPARTRRRVSGPDIDKNGQVDSKKKNDPPIREWDRGKVKDASPPLPDKEAAERRRRRSHSSPVRRTSGSRDRRGQRSRSRERTPIKKKIEKEKVEKKKEAPAKLLDELFRKTSATPNIYWLPLTEEQCKAKKAEKDKIDFEREQRRLERQREREAELVNFRDERSGRGHERERRSRRSRS